MGHQNGHSNLTWVLVLLIASAVVLRTSQGIPINSDMLKFKEETDQGTTEIEVHSDDKNMEETINNLYDQLKQLDVKALYQKRVMLKELVNETEKQLSEEEYPQYVLTREDKIYFFTKPKSTDEKMDLGLSDKDSEQLEELLEVSKKHTNNPPNILGKRNSEAIQQNNVKSPSGSIKLGEKLSEHFEETTNEVNPFDLVAAAGRWRNRAQMARHEERDDDVDFSEMIYSLQQYVNKLKGKLDEQEVERS